MRHHEAGGTGSRIPPKILLPALNVSHKVEHATLRWTVGGHALLSNSVRRHGGGWPRNGHRDGFVGIAHIGVA